METAALLELYRSDRRKLLEYLLTCGLIKQIRTSTGPIDSLSDIDFDTLSVDYILDCVRSGRVVDITEASKQYLQESAYPVMIHSRGRDSYFLVGHSELAGSPPKKVPPSIPISQTSDTSSSMSQMNYSHSEKGSENGFDTNHKVETSLPLRPSRDIEVPVLGLPKLNTGLSDDDLRESAYELLLASVLFFGVEEPSFEDRKREKGSMLLSGLKSKREKTRPQTRSFGRHSGIIDIIRGQMQISEAMDACLRRNMIQLVARRTGEPLDLPYITLGLLNGIFKSDFPNEKYYTIWKSRQANMLEELLCFSTNFTAGDRATIKSYLSKIRNPQEWDTIMSPSERVGVVACIRQMASKLSSLPGQYGVEGETFYWSASYRLNIRIYEKLLFGLFDILDEDQLVEEVDEALMLIKLTWPILGITQRIHNTLYAWILFQQFERTGESFLLESATNELQKVLSCKEDDRKEKQYMNSLVCSPQFGGKKLKLSMMQVILILISMCCVNKLESYHLHFSKKPSQFKMMMNLLSMVGIAASDSQAEVKLIKMTASDANVSRKLKSYVKSSIKAACELVSSTLDLKSKAEGKHPLAILAYELKLVAQREGNVFFPVLCHLCPEALLISMVVLHGYFGERLKPFLKGVSSLSQEVRSVFPAADLLDRYLTQIYTSALEANRGHLSSNQSLDHYQIREVSKPIILDWVISQHSRILEWTHRVIDIEDWEPLSSHQRQAASIVEVFRIVEETVDQIFGLDLPMDITHLQALLSVIFHTLDTYLQKLLSQLVEKSNLYPAAPPLTRYTESIMPVIRKKVESKILDDNVSDKLSKLTLSKLCVMLNTLQYIQKQVGTLEDGIRKHGTCVRSLHIQEREKPKEDESLHDSPMSEPLEEDCLFTCNEEVDALFATTLSIIEDTTTNAIKRMCDFTGACVVFWDLREKFLFCLYCGDVESSRLEVFLPLVDKALDQICGLIDDSLRDLVVLSVCRALLEGFVWVLLDGGPSRAFSDTDVKLLEEDFNILKEFFIANGEGLPRSLVEQEAKYAQEILSLFSLETESIGQMLMIASESLSTRLDSNGHVNKPFEDAHTLLRVLSHKKDREASKFLKSHYQLPMSSEYEENTNSGDSTSSPLISDLLKRSASIRWSETGQKGFRSMKKKLQEAQLKLVT